MAADAIGRWFDRTEEILGVDWEQVFPPGVNAMTPTGFYVRMALDNQTTGGTSVGARETLYEPALELALERGDLILTENDDGEIVVCLPEGQTGRGRFARGDEL